MARFKHWLNKTIASFNKRIKAFLKRRPHRSFQLTRRRDYKRSFDAPGYWAFSYEVWTVLWKYRRISIIFLAVYCLAVAAAVGIMSQDMYSELSDIFFGRDDTVGIIDNFGAATSAAVLFAASVASALTHQLGPTQQVIGGFLLVMAWLVVVWLLRQLMAGHSVKFRDGLYNAGAPIVATLAVVMVIMFQLVPLALAMIAYNVAAGNGFFINGVEAMTAWAALLLVGLLSLYWITSSLIALVIVTLPGVYPFRALGMASDLVVGRRLRVMLRLAWLMLGILPIWAIVLIPLIFLEGWLQVDWLPIVPVAVLILSGGSVLWSATYVYLLYRKLIDDEAPPA